MASSSSPPSRARTKFYLLLLLVCLVVFAYPPYRLYAWHDGVSALAVHHITLTILIWGVSAFALWFSFSSPKKWLRVFTVHWLGVSFILLVPTVVYEIVRLFLPWSDRLAAQLILVVAAVATLSALAAAHIIRVKRLRFASAKVTRNQRVVQISDVHIGSRQAGYLRRIVRRISALRPDVVVITGDLLDSAAVGYAELKSLRDLTERSRVLFCIGNHERYADLDKALRVLGKLGVQTLRQARVVCGQIEFIGIDDADDPQQVAKRLPNIISRAGNSAGATKSANSRYCVLLYHRPHGWSAARSLGVDLMLCGHTHNGQIFPFNLLVKRQFARINGLYQSGGSVGGGGKGKDEIARLYVSPGSGTWGPLMRLGSLNEITCIDIVPATMRASNLAESR